MPNKLEEAGISWIIIGAVTKAPNLPQPKSEWVREIVEAADKAGCAVFLKDNLKHLLLDYWNDKILVSSWMHRGEFRDFDIRLRQEVSTR